MPQPELGVQFDRARRRALYFGSCDDP